MDLLQGLNEPQRAAVTHSQGPLLIFAGAGSGKTRTLTHRIAYLIQNGVSPHRILAVTFTNKAAREMRERLENLVGGVAKRMWLGTFHALCAQMLRIHGERIGLNPRFVIFDSDDQLRLMKEVVKDLNLDTQRFPPARMLGRVSDAKNELQTPDEMAAKATRPHERIYATIYTNYQRRLREQSALDFDDLLVEAVRLLKESPQSLEHWSERFQHVLIDEFQDVNEAQFQWAQMLASKHRNICVVGDDDQCLAEGTLVSTPDGEKPIEEIRAGDCVLSGIGDGKTTRARVTHVKSQPFCGEILHIETASSQFCVTPNHRCFAADHAVKIPDSPGENVVVLNAFAEIPRNQPPVHSISTNVLARAKVWETRLDYAEEAALNLARSVGGASIYRVASFLKNQPFALCLANDLRPGMRVPVLQNGAVVSEPITRIQRESYEGNIYDLEVESTRNFAANGVLVHNSIYAWRGANVKIILDFEKKFADATVVRLEQNYRSTQNILDAAHGVISHNFGRAAKQLWSEDKGGESLVLHGALNAQEEALWVVRRIETLRREERFSLDDFAILCRVNAQSRPFEEAFLRNRVPLRLVGTQRFYDRREIRDVLAYLKFIYNPDDAISANRLINVPPRGIGTATVQKLENLAIEQNRSLGALLLDPETQKALTPAVARKIEPLQRLLLQIFADANAVKTIADMLEKILERTQILDFLAGEKDGETIDRVANVEELLRAAEYFDLRMAEDVLETGETSDVWDESDPLRLGLFLGETALEGGTDKDSEADEAVTLMTLHAAKGLEFKVVFLVGLEEGLLPHARAVWGENAGDEQLEEERRLMYVGLTRGEKRVLLSYAAQRTMHGRTESTQPSQFLNEIPGYLLAREGLAAQGGARLVQNRSTSWGGYGGNYASNRANLNDLPRPQTPSAPSFASARGAKTEEKPPTFRVGDKIKHGSYGEGLVVAASLNGGAGEWVEVAFLGEGIGKKKLIVAYANLEKAS